MKPIRKNGMRLIPSDRNRVDYDCVCTMAGMYRRALRGEFQAVAIATVKEGGDDGCFGTVWSTPTKTSEMAGAINYLNHRFLVEVID